MKIQDIDREKDLSELTDEEKQVIRDNADSLSESDKEIFGDILEEDQGDNEEQKGLNFKTEEELDTWLDKREERRKEEAERAKQEEEERKKEYKFFDEKEELPKDWNDAFNRAYPKFKERLAEEQRQAAEESKRLMEEANKKIDSELSEIRKADKDIPASNTEDGKAFDADLIKIAVKYKQSSIKNAYELKRAFDARKKLEGETGEPENTEVTPTPPPAPRPNQAARRIGGKRGGEGGAVKKYSEIAGRSLDEVMDEALGEIES